MRDIQGAREQIKGKKMSTRSSLAYKKYDEGIVHIYYEQIDEKYFITDERHGIVELPEKLAQKFSKVITAETKGKNAAKTD